MLAQGPGPCSAPAVAAEASALGGLGGFAGLGLSGSVGKRRAALGFGAAPGSRPSPRATWQRVRGRRGAARSCVVASEWQQRQPCSLSCFSLQSLLVHPACICQPTSRCVHFICTAALLHVSARAPGFAHLPQPLQSRTLLRTALPHRHFAAEGLPMRRHEPSVHGAGARAEVADAGAASPCALQLAAQVLNVFAQLGKLFMLDGLLAQGRWGAGRGGWASAGATALPAGIAAMQGKVAAQRRWEQRRRQRLTTAPLDATQHLKIPAGSASCYERHRQKGALLREAWRAVSHQGGSHGAPNDPRHHKVEPAWRPAPGAFGNDLGVDSRLQGQAGCDRGSKVRRRQLCRRGRRGFTGPQTERQPLRASELRRRGEAVAKKDPSNRKTSYRQRRRRRQAAQPTGELFAASLQLAELASTCTNSVTGSQGSKRATGHPSRGPSPVL